MRNRGRKRGQRRGLGRGQARTHGNMGKRGEREKRESEPWLSNSR